MCISVGANSCVVVSIVRNSPNIYVFVSVNVYISTACMQCCVVVSTDSEKFSQSGSASCSEFPPCYVHLSHRLGRSSGHILVVLKLNNS